MSRFPLGDPTFPTHAGHVDRSGEGKGVRDQQPDSTPFGRAQFISTRDFLSDAHRGGLLDDETYGLLRELLERRWWAEVLDAQRAAPRLRLPEGQPIILLPPAPV